MMLTQPCAGFSFSLLGDVGLLAATLMPIRSELADLLRPD